MRSLLLRHSALIDMRIIDGDCVPLEGSNRLLLLRHWTLALRCKEETLKITPYVPLGPTHLQKPYWKECPMRAASAANADNSA